jgi:polysaccharide biosynthesis protein PslH
LPAQNLLIAPRKEAPIKIEDGNVSSISVRTCWALRIMKILWVKTDYLHPTTRGGQIRSLEMLRCLHRKHEIHYVCLDDGSNEEGPQRSNEYSSKAIAVHHTVPPRRSVHFLAQLALGAVSPLPVSVARYKSAAMKAKIAEMLASESYDSLVCDFLFPAPNIPDMSSAVLFQHNVEAVIWKRHVEQAPNPIARTYLGVQARRMQDFERNVCRRSAHVVAVSDLDVNTMVASYGVDKIDAVETGVDIDYFAPPTFSEPKADLVFVGSMDWLPNIDGVKFFSDEILPRIRARRPACKIAIVGRLPGPAIEELGRRDPNIIVTGTVPDVRPWLWGSAVSVVPLRIGGGTRLKILEAMAAKVPVVSTSIGAEGLPVEPGRHLFVADDAATFAQSCLDLLEDGQRRSALAESGWSLVRERFSWEAVTRKFEAILERTPAPK